MSRIDQLKSFLEADPNDSFTRFALALEYQKAGQIHDAKEFFVYIITHDPEYVGVYYHLGKLYETEGNLTKASETYTKGIDVALASKDLHAANELREALLSIDDD
jgi:Tfp pilus assembly protein PilF